MTLREEVEKAAQEGKEIIPPYKLNAMMKLAGKIVNLLTDNMATVTLSYGDMKVIMRIVDNALSQGAEQPIDRQSDDWRRQIEEK